MISESDLKLLLQDEVKNQIERNISRSHIDVALDKSLDFSALIATQIKFLQRAKKKLPQYYNARCIIPPRAFEQSSSEATAAAKSISGDSILELTCGLGVDTMALAQRFKNVVTIERDSTLAKVAAENFKRLGATNIEVINCAAEEYLSKCDRRFDWIYVDPDRRSEDGKKRVILEDCSPNIIALEELIKRTADAIAIKCSPIFDIDEAFRLYPGCRVEVVSLGDECKEVNIYLDRSTPHDEVIGAVAIGRGEVWLKRADASKITQTQITQTQPLDMGEYKYLIIPDVALQKARIAQTILSEISTIENNNGYGFATEQTILNRDERRHIARIEQIEWAEEYNPKKICKELANRGIKRAEILKRDFPYSTSHITKQLKITEGGGQKIAFTKLNNRLIILILAR